jgi:hypothetical protein
VRGQKIGRRIRSRPDATFYAASRAPYRDAMGSSDSRGAARRFVGWLFRDRVLLDKVTLIERSQMCDVAHNICVFVEPHFLGSVYRNPPKDYNDNVGECRL